jgi:hypothetical protein
VEVVGGEVGGFDGAEGGKESRWIELREGVNLGEEWDQESIEG